VPNISTGKSVAPFYMGPLSFEHISTEVINQWPWCNLITRQDFDVYLSKYFMIQGVLVNDSDGVLET